MKNLKTRYVLGIDPSGSYKEGKGITGWNVFDRETDSVIMCGEIKAVDYPTQEEYWLAHNCLIGSVYTCYGDAGCVISMEDYILYASNARNQINSGMETCQLIGVIKVLCFASDIPLRMRTASIVKHRWTDEILCHKEYIFKNGDSYYTACYPKLLSVHIRDSIRHSVHCATFELKEE